MKVLFVIDNLGGGGAQKLIYDLVMKMENERVEILLLSNRSDKYYSSLKEKGIPVYIVPDTCRSAIGKLNYMWKVIKNGGYSVIHANLFPAFYYVAIIKRIHRYDCPPVLMTEHSTDNNRRKKRYFKPVEKIIYGSYDHIISISKETQNALLKWLGTNDDSKFSVIENGIDVEKYQNAQAYMKEDLFPEYKNGDLLIGMVGSFTPQKNHKMMFEAMDILHDEYKLILVGEGPLLEEMKDLAQKKNLSSRIMFLGFRKDVAEIIKTVDIVCVPSVWEGFGLVAVEAMAAGKPVVVSEVPGLAGVVGNCGILVRPDKPDSIAKGIERASIDGNAPEKYTHKLDEYNILRTKDGYVNIFKQFQNTRR